MQLLGVELACVACLDNGGSVLKHLRPVKTAPEDLASEGTRRRVVATFAAVDVSDEHSSFLRGDTLECNSVWVFAVQVPSRMKYDFTWRATRSASGSFSRRVPFRR